MNGTLRLLTAALLLALGMALVILTLVLAADMARFVSDYDEYRYARQYVFGLLLVAALPLVGAVALMEAERRARRLLNLLVWTKMHDAPARNYADCDLLYSDYQRSPYPDTWEETEGKNWFRYLRTRPAERYEAWVLAFAAPSPLEQRQHIIKFDP